MPNLPNVSGIKRGKTSGVMQVVPSQPDSFYEVRFACFSSHVLAKNRTYRQLKRMAAFSA